MMLPNEFNNIIEKFGGKLVGKFDEYIKVEKEKNELLASIRNKLSDIAALQALAISIDYSFVSLEPAQSDNVSKLQIRHVKNAYGEYDEYCYYYYNDCKNLEQNNYDMENGGESNGNQ